MSNYQNLWKQKHEKHVLFLKAILHAWNHPKVFPCQCFCNKNVDIKCSAHKGFVKLTSSSGTFKVKII